MEDDKGLLVIALEHVCQELWIMHGFTRDVDDAFAVMWALQTYSSELTEAYCRVTGGCDDDEG